MYNIIFKNGSNKIELFKDMKEFGKWWSICVKLGIHNPGTILRVTKIN